MSRPLLPPRLWPTPGVTRAGPLGLLDGRTGRGLLLSPLRSLSPAWCRRLLRHKRVGNTQTAMYGELSSLRSFSLTALFAVSFAGGTVSVHSWHSISFVSRLHTCTLNHHVQLVVLVPLVLMLGVIRERFAASHGRADDVPLRTHRKTLFTAAVTWVFGSMFGSLRLAKFIEVK